MIKQICFFRESFLDPQDTLGIINTQCVLSDPNLNSANPFTGDGGGFCSGGECMDGGGWSNLLEEKTGLGYGHSEGAGNFYEPFGDGGSGFIIGYGECNGSGIG